VTLSQKFSEVPGQHVYNQQRRAKGTLTKLAKPSQISNWQLSHSHKWLIRQNRAPPPALSFLKPAEATPAWRGDADNASWCLSTADKDEGHSGFSRSRKG